VSAAASELPERNLRLAEVQQLVPYSKVHLARLEKAGRFPARIKIGPARVVWRKADILAWLAAKAAEANTP